MALDPFSHNMAQIISHFILQFAEAVILNMEDMHKESNKRTPLICFLTMGSDPTENIMLLAKKLNIRT